MRLIETMAHYLHCSFTHKCLLESKFFFEMCFFNNTVCVGKILKNQSKQKTPAFSQM